MNAKKAKALRKLMRNMEKQQDPSKEPIPDRAYMEITSRAKYIIVTDEEVQKPEGEPVDPLDTQVSMKPGGLDLSLEEGTATGTTSKTRKVKIASGQIINGQNSKRAIYLHLKKELTKIGNVL